jgi:hypothetical protein
MAPGLDKALGRFNDELPALYRLLADTCARNCPRWVTRMRRGSRPRRSVSQPTRRPQRGLPDLFAFTGPTGNWQL